MKYFKYHGDKSFSEWISKTWKSLKRLKLGGITGINELSISSSSLEHIIINQLTYSNDLFSILKLQQSTLSVWILAGTSFLLKISNIHLKLKLQILKGFAWGGMFLDILIMEIFGICMVASCLCLYSLSGNKQVTSINQDMVKIFQTIAQCSAFEVNETSIKVNYIFHIIWNCVFYLFTHYLITNQLWNVF